MKPFSPGLLIVGVSLLHLAWASFILTQNNQGADIACCPQGQGPGPDCCDTKLHLPGSDKAGYRCCSLDQFAKGVVCGSLGKSMVDGKCVCPPNMVENAEGVCELATSAPSCESGLGEGRCYILKFGDGMFGLGKGGEYDIVDESRKTGKFKFCKTEACSGKSTINPNDEFRIYDVHGDDLVALNTGVWFQLDQGFKTTNKWNDASRLSITRWTDGKYCLSVVYDTFIDQHCIPLGVLEVPCDLRAPQNNCMWGDTSGGSKEACAKHVEYSVAEKPIEEPDEELAIHIPWFVVSPGVFALLACGLLNAVDIVRKCMR